MKNLIERRFNATQLHLRGAGDDAVLWGRAAAFNKISHDLGGFRERLAPGCFANALAHPSIKDCYLAQNHNSSMIVGRVGSGNLQLSEQPDGLYFSCQLPNTQLARDMRELVRTGVLNQCSFAFGVPCLPDAEDWNDEMLGKDDLGEDFDDERAGNGDLYANRVRCKVRTVRQVMPLIDVSCVQSPAYGNGSTNANARALFFPEGVPVSVRSHVKDADAVAAYQRMERRKFISRITQ
jgi:HK97 family phage prohead protease